MIKSQTQSLNRTDSETWYLTVAPLTFWKKRQKVKKTKQKTGKWQIKVRLSGTHFYLDWTGEMVSSSMCLLPLKTSKFRSNFVKYRPEITKTYWWNISFHFFDQANFRLISYFCFNIWISGCLFKVVYMIRILYQLTQNLATFWANKTGVSLFTK